jgi:hypothetical protein
VRSSVGHGIRKAGSFQRTPRGVLRRIELRDLIEDLGVVLERLEAMGEPGRDVHSFSVVRGEDNGEVLAERRRLGPEVDDDVE